LSRRNRRMAGNALRSRSQHDVRVTRLSHAAPPQIRLSEDRFMSFLPFARLVSGRVVFVVMARKNRD
jgi:hypothetical protein